MRWFSSASISKPLSQLSECLKPRVFQQNCQTRSHNPCRGAGVAHGHGLSEVMCLESSHITGPESRRKSICHMLSFRIGQPMGCEAHQQREVKTFSNEKPGLSGLCKHRITCRRVPPPTPRSLLHLATPRLTTEDPGASRQTREANRNALTNKLAMY